MTEVDSVPADGRVVDGTAAMDESMVTGESRTVRRGVGDSVVAGTVGAGIQRKFSGKCGKNDAELRFCRPR